MPQDAAQPASAYPSSGVTWFPADIRAVRIGADEFAAGGLRTLRFHLTNENVSAGDANGNVLHVRLAPGASWITHILPSETALGPNERQAVVVTVDADAARKAVRGGGAPAAPVRLLYQLLFSASGGEREAAVYVNLPVALCPACHRALETAAIADPGAHNSSAIPDVCPFCFERLRPCPVCGAPNSWLARRCVLDETHVIRAGKDWNAVGGSPAHEGTTDTASPAIGLARRWTYPNVAPARRESALAWSAPVAAYGMVAAAAATASGDAHIYAFDAVTGAPLWEPYPLPDPIYPDRGGIAISGGRLFAATVDGVCVGLDALRGTRIWQTLLPGHIYGAVVPVDENGESLLAAVALNDSPGGALFVINGVDGSILSRSPLPGLPDAAPTASGGRAFVHDDSGTISAFEIATGAVLWSAQSDSRAGFDAAPVVSDGQVISADAEGTVTRRDITTGEELWRLAVTNAPFGGTPATDGVLVYLPADDGVHLISADAGRAVRRYPTRQPVRSAPVISGGTLLFGCTDGNIYGAVPGRGLEKLYETGTTGSQIIAAPAVSDGALFLAATNGVLYALTLVEGASNRAV